MDVSLKRIFKCRFDWMRREQTTAEHLHLTSLHAPLVPYFCDDFQFDIATHTKQHAPLRPANLEIHVLLTLTPASQSVSVQQQPTGIVVSTLWLVLLICPRAGICNFI
ncbi:conserved hypothetical protein [Trichinella spiralis]|uniref:hypothetical protein n=1 Tax=Trichinella spiralis TaxID=6334 RepID=UPI0001EFB21E|nr:conserved hypothetical protein [Trichinella spiralis]